MLSTKELFGINPLHFKEMKYETVLLIKKQIATDLISNELKKHYTERDYHRITQLAKAIKNMDKLLNEMKETKCTVQKNKLKLLIMHLLHLCGIRKIIKK